MQTETTCSEITSTLKEVSPCECTLGFQRKGFSLTSTCSDWESALWTKKVKAWPHVGSLLKLQVCNEKIVAFVLAYSVSSKEYCHTDHQRGAQ